MKDKVAIITGASTGIGREIALSLAADGVLCGLFADSTEDLAPIAAEIAAAGGPTPICHSLDLSSADLVKLAVKQFVERTGRLDFLVNAAGCTVDELDSEERDGGIAADLSGALCFTRAALRPMLDARKGRIVNVTSVLSEMGTEGRANTTAARARVIAYTKVMAREVASSSITVNAVAPGYVETGRTAGLSDEVKKSLTESIPLGRIGTPADVAAVVKYLLSDGAAYVTGQVVGVNGGLYM